MPSRAAARPVVHAPGVVHETWPLGITSLLRVLSGQSCAFH